MGVVYRVTDLNDNQIKYVGIVWSGNRTLKKRMEEHRKNDSWFDPGHWCVEYLQREVRSRTDAEYLEAHYTSKFRDPEGEWFGKTKLNWGTSDIIDDSHDEWIVYSTDEEEPSDLMHEEKWFIWYSNYCNNVLGQVIVFYNRDGGRVELVFSDCVNICIGKNNLFQIKTKNLLYEIFKEDKEIFEKMNDNKVLIDGKPFVGLGKHELTELKKQYTFNVKVFADEINGIPNKYEILGYSFCYGDDGYAFIMLNDKLMHLLEKYPYDDYIEVIDAKHESLIDGIKRRLNAERNKNYDNNRKCSK